MCCKKGVRGFLIMLTILSLFLKGGDLFAGFPNPYDGLWLGNDMSLSDDYNGVAHSAWANLGIKLTGRYSTTPPAGTFMYVFETLGGGLLKSNAMVNYVDVILRKALDGDTSTPVEYDEDGDFHYISGYEAKALIDRQCLDVMVQTICFSMYVADVNGDGRIVSYDPNNSNTYLHFRASTGNDGNERTKDDYIYMEVSLANVAVDVLIEPPLNSELDPSESLNYLCSDQVPGHPIYGCIPSDPDDPSKPANSDDVPRVLDYYVKAWTVAQVNQIKMRVGIQLQSVFYPDQGEVSKIGFNLESINIEGDFQMTLNRGPFCDDPGGDTLGHTIPRDNENNCYAGFYADATHDATNFMTELIPFINAELKMEAEDIWQDDTPGTPGYYFGPTMLIDITDLTKNLAIPNPVYPQPNSITIELSMRSSDSIPTNGGSTDSYGDFWTDYFGILAVFDLGIRAKFLDANTGAPIDSCMDDSGTLSGYVDGWGMWSPLFPPVWLDNTSDDPADILTNTNQNVQFKNNYGGYITANSTIRNTTRGLLWYDRMPILAGPGDVKTYSDVYSVGIALHQNLLNKLIYDLVTRGVFCLDLDARSGSGDDSGGMGVDLSSILNTSFFKYIFPALADKFPDADMRIRAYPALKDFSGGGHTPAPSELGNLPDWQKPYIVVGGPKIRTPNYTFIPDLTLVIPNYLIQFYVYDDSAGGVLRRALGINTTLVVGIHFDLLKVSDPSVTLPSGYTYNGTWYPIGCDSDGNTSDCDIQADTLRVLRFAAMVHPFVNAVLTYEEMDDYTTNNAFENTNYYINGISQILGVLLSSRLDLAVNIGFDPGAFLGMPLSFNFVKVGGSYVANNATTNLTDGDNNGYGDYLEIGIKIEDYFGGDPNLIGKYILRLVDTLMSGNLMGGGGLSLGGAPGVSGVPGVTWKYDPQAKPLLGFNDFFDEPMVVPQKLGVIIPVKEDFPDSYEISYRMDEGLWSPFFRPDDELKFYDLPEGWHKIEVAFKGPGAKELIRNNITYTFLADYTPPEIEGIDIKNRNGNVDVVLHLKDNFTPSNALKVEYRVDGSSWREASDVRFGFSLNKEGMHLLELKVQDSAGNVAYAGKKFVYEASGFGCTAGGNIPDILILLLLPLLFLLIRRSVEF